MIKIVEPNSTPEQEQGPEQGQELILTQFQNWAKEQSDKKELIPAFERWLKENPVKLLDKLEEKGMDSSKNLTFSIHSENGEDSLKIEQEGKEIRLDYKEVIQDIPYP